MSAKIARGSSNRGKTRSRAPSRGSSRKPTPGMLDALPLPAETIRRVSGWILGLMLLALALAIAAAFRLPQKAGVEVGEAIGRAGFTVRRIEPKGLNRMNPMAVYEIASDQLDRAMPLVDLDQTRDRLLRFGWVQDARVSRRLPDTLVVDIVERKAAAIWQHNQELTLIDRDGVVLEPVKLEAMPDLPLVIGPAANRHASELNQLLAAAPQLKPMLAGATWIGGRRWDLRFHSGEVLALPEGPEASRDALLHFARMDRATQLLGRGFVRFDMRIPGKLIVRVSREPGSSVPDIANTPPPPANQPVTDTAKTI
jgi:cell division protein FtsQ